MLDTLKKSRILIVDDNQLNIELLSIMLSHEGYDNISALSDSREVLGHYKKWRYDLILLDIRMPYFDGFQVMEQLSTVIDGDYLPVLVLTAQTDMKTRLKALEMGAKDFLTKPFDKTEVLTRISNLLEVRHLYNVQRRQSEILEAKVRERTRELEETRLEIIRRLGVAAEFRDNETGMHVIRMSKSCKILALRLGLGKKKAEKILNASPMHDVGKIGIPDNILLKPGKLDAKEWEVMITHSRIGYDLLGDHPSDIIRLAAEIALSHHEKWDGSGYPNGQKGEEIIIEGRIAAVADVFDALTSERPYKKAWPVKESLDCINGQSGVHFDPTVVDAFKESLPEILRVREKYKDE